MKKINYLFILLFLIALVSCSKNQYEVKFIGYNNEIIKTMKISEKDDLKYPIAPEVEGYVFIKWDKDIKNVVDNTVITAIYEIKQFKVKFYNELDEVISEQTVKYGESCTAPNSPNKEGNEFIGWDKDFSVIKSDLDIKPMFEKHSFIVKFYNEDGTVIKTETVNFGESATQPANLIKEGHNFVGWDQDISCVKSNLNVKPMFEPKSFTVKFYDINGNVIKTEIVNYGKSAVGVTLGNKEGYNFIGWDQEFSNVKSDLDIKPIYELKTFIVNFYDDEGNIIKTETVNYGENAEGASVPIKEGYKFIRWDENLEQVKSDLDVFPIYEILSYKVTFVDFYGNVLKTEMVKYKESATAPDLPVVEYHIFSKWSLKFNEVKSDMTIKAIYNKNYKSYVISDVNYWLQILSSEYDINKTILSNTSINDYNAQIISSYSKTEVVDVLSLTDNKSSSYITSLINNYNNINKYTVYNKDTNVALTSTEKNNILSNRNLNNIPSSVEIKYGVITDFAWMRSYPTNHYSNVYSMDRFQETSLNVGEGVAIYHESSDKEWYFVQAENYNGWVEKKYIAECSYDNLKSFLKPEKNLLVIADYVTLQSAHVRMGQTFPLLNVNSDSYVIGFPTRNSSGELIIKELTIAKSSDYHEGYLDYTYRNVFVQAFKLLGIDYSWGDKDKLGRDCSSTMNAIYKCFGFMMPRNTTNQVAIPTYGSKVSGLNNTTIQNYKPGSLIFTSSHVMLYLGENANGIAYLLHNTTSGDGACILQSLDDYGGSRINGVLKLQ